MPLTLDGALLIVVVTLLEMLLGVSLAAGHCANREHSPTLALFEIRDQHRKPEKADTGTNDELCTYLAGKKAKYWLIGTG
jgi:hypothetical protein